MGYAEGSNTYIILTAQGAVRCRSIKRRPLSERWNPGLLDLTFHVLQPDPLRQGEERIGVRVPVTIDTPVNSDDGPTDAAQRAPQRTRLNKKDFELHGFTPGCAGCEARKPGAVYHGSHPPNHNQTCRSTMETILSQSSEGRLRLDEAEARATRR